MLFRVIKLVFFPIMTGIHLAIGTRNLLLNLGIMFAMFLTTLLFSFLIKRSEQETRGSVINGFKVLGVGTLITWCVLEAMFGPSSDHPDWVRTIEVPLLLLGTLTTGIWLFTEEETEDEP